MTLSDSILTERFQGCLLGLAVGDALGGKFEAQSADAIRARFPSVERLISYPQEEIWYTDDTQMAIGISEALIERGAIVEDVLCRAFVANYVPSRGYGRGTRAVLEAMEEGRDYRQVAEQHFPAARSAMGQPCASPQLGWSSATIGGSCASKLDFRHCRRTFTTEVLRVERTRPYCQTEPPPGFAACTMSRITSGSFPTTNENRPHPAASKGFVLAGGSDR